jgi:hypothetical protein
VDEWMLGKWYFESQDRGVGIGMVWYGIGPGGWIDESKEMLDSLLVTDVKILTVLLRARPP